MQNKRLSFSKKHKKLSKKKKIKKVTKQNLKVNNPSQQQLSILLEYYQNRQFDNAEKLAVSITNEFPKHEFAWKVLGAVFGATGRTSQAVDANRAAVALASQDAAAHNNLGNNLKKLGRLDEAVASYTQAIMLKSDYAEAHSNLGITLKELGKLDGALASYTQAIALKPDYAEAHNNLGNTLKELGKLDDALASYKQAIALKPDYAEAHSNLGNALKKLGRLSEAEASYTQAIALKPDYAEAHSNLGITLKELGRLDESIDYLKQAIELNSDGVQARMSLNSAVNLAVPSWHFPMMNDEERNKAYADALELAVRDGDFVLDIGTGSGLLSLMAAASGAEMVITCEMSKTIAEAATQIIESNGYKEKISVLNKKSTNLIIGEDLPQQADLIISEVLSSELVGEGVRATLLDANRRLLKKGGRTIPQSGKIRIALIDNSPEIFDKTSVASVQGFDLSLFNSISPKKLTSKLRDKPMLLSNPTDAFHINFTDTEGTLGQEKIIKLQVNQDGLCVGLIQWIWIHLYGDIEYENKPGECDSHWHTPIYLFDEPVVAKKGDVIEIKAVLGDDYVWFWKRP